MKKGLILAGCLAMAGGVCGEMMRACVLQAPFALDPAKIDASVQWQLDALAKCDESLDLIVLPEGSDRQGAMTNRTEVIAKYNAPVLAACAATAKRCKAVVFVNAIDFTPTGQRNTTFAFDKTGACVGKYDKQHLTYGEWAKTKLDSSYMWTWSEPPMMVIDGIKYAFLTCYDFYFYENLSNIARYKPDIIIGCSHQRSDRHDALEMFGRFIAYHTAAYLVRASVSMGLDSPIGGCSMVVSPAGEVLGNMFSRVGVLTVDFDPKAKYLKPAGYRNPLATHPEYIEVGRRPWKYRPGGSAIVPGVVESELAMPKRLCAHRGFSTVAPENTLPAYGAAVGLGAAEIEFDLWWTKDGEIVSVHDDTLPRVSNGKGKVYEHTYAELAKLDFGSKASKRFAGLRIARFEDILQKFSCHTIMNIHLKTLPNRPWNEEHLKKVIRLIDAYDARRHVYFMTACQPLHAQLRQIAPDIPRCMGNGGSKTDDIVERAIAAKCKMVQLCKPYFNEGTIKRAHAAGLRCNVFWSDDPTEAKKFLDMGIDTILTNDYLLISEATGLK